MPLANDVLARIDARGPRTVSAAMRQIALAVLVIGSFAAGTAAARQNPKPPDSGIIIHPFGPPGAKPVPAPVILHRMFVTGAPDQKPGQALPRGRAGFARKKPSP
jgi:hypothetical protein